MHIAFKLIKARTPWKFIGYHVLKIVLKIEITLDVKKTSVTGKHCHLYRFVTITLKLIFPNLKNKKDFFILFKAITFYELNTIILIGFVLILNKEQLANEVIMIGE